MGKRKNKDRSRSPSDEVSNRKLYKRIKKLETELKRREDRRHNSVPYSTHEYGNRFRRESTTRTSPSKSSYYRSRSRSITSYSNDRDRSEQTGRECNPSGSHLSGSQTPPFHEQQTEPLIINTAPELEDEILKILGEDPEQSDSTKSELHIAITSRWAKILTTGILEEERLKLKDKYPIPENLKLLNPPEVNPELLGTLQAHHKKRDSCYVDFQDQLAKGIAALGEALNLLLESKEDLPIQLKEKLLNPIWDSGRLLTNLFNGMTQVRRTLVAQVLTKQIKEVTDSTAPGEFLFGAELGEKIKQAKMLDKATKELMPSTPKQYKKAATTKTNLTTGGGGKRQAYTSYHAGNYPRPVRRRETRPFRGQYRPLKEQQYVPRRRI